MSKQVEWPYWPQPGSQNEMWESLAPDADVQFIGYGGPRGGGKSFGMRSFFATICMSLPVTCCIVRQTYKDLMKNHINPLLMELRPYIDAGIVKFNSQDNVMTFTQTGAQILFMYCRNDKDLDRFQGQSYDILGIEEAGQFTEDQIKYMISSNRTSHGMIGYKEKHGVRYKPKCLMTFNWGGPGHGFLRRVFWDGQYVPHVNKDADLGVYQEGEQPDKFKFIFAPFDQNIALKDADPEYQERLRLLSPQLQKAYIDGDPDAFMGTLFRIAAFVHGQEPFEIPDTWTLFGALDPGTGDFCSFGLYAKSPNGQIFKIFTYYVKGKDPISHRDAIHDRIRSCKYTKGRMPDYIVAGMDAFARKNKLDIGAHDITWKHIFSQKGMYLRRCINKRVPGCMAMETVLAYEYDFDEKVITRHPKLKYFEGYNKSTLEELRALERDPNNPHDVKQGTEIADHAYDETRYAIMSAVTPFDFATDDDDLDMVEDGYGIPEGGGTFDANWIKDNSYGWEKMC